MSRKTARSTENHHRINGGSPDPHGGIGPIEVVPLDALTEDPANVRIHGPENLAAVEASLKRFGQVQALVVDGANRVLAGNARLRVMRRLGWATARVVRVAHWTPEMAAAYAIADNRTAELADWDDAGLAKVLVGFPQDLRLDTGFDETVLANLFEQAAGKAHEQNIPPGVLPDEATRIGDIWHLGNHRLICADSTDPRSYASVLDSLGEGPWGGEGAGAARHHVAALQRENAVCCSPG